MPKRSAMFGNFPATAACALCLQRREDNAVAGTMLATKHGRRSRQHPAVSAASTLAQATQALCSQTRKEDAGGRATRPGMGANSSIVAHLIVGEKPEPYLAAALEAIADVCDYAVVNDNSGLPHSANSAIASQSQLAKRSCLVLVRTHFSDFASARNECIAATPENFHDGWALFVDADEVHGAELQAMAALLPRLPDGIDAVDGYSRHFVGSFGWWMSIERRRRFFRLRSGRRWYGNVHEQLAPLERVIVLPAVWCHYGHVVTPRAEAEKSRLYAQLGGGDAPPEDMLGSLTPAMVWSRLLRKANRFHGRHPAAATQVVAALSQERAAIFAEVDLVARRQTAVDKARNALYRMNVARLLAWRRLEARAHWGWPSGGATARTLSYA